MRGWLDALGELPILPIIRQSSAERALQIANVFVDAGWPILEVALTTPGAIEVIRRLRRERPAVVVGAGTVLTVDMARDAVAADASFLVAPNWSEAVATWTRDQVVPYLPGVMTPSDVANAVQGGFTVLKLFPAVNLGIEYLRAIAKVFPNVQFVPTGGIGIADVKAWLSGGAIAAGVGGAFTDGTLEEIRRRAVQALRGWAG